MNEAKNLQNTTETSVTYEPVLAPVFVYEFLYNSDCCESAAATISIHKTKKGAEMAMEYHKNEIKQKWEQEKKEHFWEDPHFYRSFEWDYNQWWGVRECELLP